MNTKAFEQTSETASILAALNPEQRTAAQILTGPAMVISGPGTGKTNLTVNRIAYMIHSGIEASSILALTFTNKAAAEMRSRVNRKCKEAGYPVITGTYHSFCSRVLRKYESHDFFKSLGYLNGFITLDDDNTNKLMDEARKSVDSVLVNLLDAADYKRKEIFSFIGKERARGFIVGEVASRIMKSKPDFKKEWDEVCGLAASMGDDGNYQVKNLLQNIFKTKPYLVQMAACHVWKAYNAGCKAVDGVDFDDMLIMVDRLIRSDERVARSLAMTHPYVLLDEYQDTNPVQASIIDNIVKYHPNNLPNLFTVGDARQSIYKFREANVHLMIGFKDRYPLAQSVSMYRNYRSSQKIIDIANAFGITMNGQLTDGQLKAERQFDHDTEATLSEFVDDRDEADGVAKGILKSIAGGTNPDEIFVLYRNRSVKVELEKALAKHGVEYEVVGDISFWERAEVKDIVALARVFMRQNDTLALARVLDNTKAGITGVSLRKQINEKRLPALEILEMAANKNGVRAATTKTFLSDLVETKKRAGNYIDWLSFFKDYAYEMQIADGDTRAEALAFVDETVRSLTNGEKDAIIRSFEKECNNKYSDYPLAEHLKSFWEKHMAPLLEEDDRKALTKKDASDDDIQQAWAKRVESVDIVLDHLRRAAFSGQLADDIINEMTLRTESANQRNEDAVKLMTIHASKGLEADTVFMVGLEQETFMRSEDNTAEDNDEEGRVFYVAATRAGVNIHMSYANRRQVNGMTNDMRPVEFLEPIKHLMEFKNYATKERTFNREVPADIEDNQYNTNTNVNSQIVAPVKQHPLISTLRL